MKIFGFQKMTLLDFPGKVACTVFTGGCNFRCPFCHNAALVTEIDPAARYDEADILAYLSTRTGLLDGVAVTGGEPLLQPDIAGFIRKIRAMGYAVKLDTNGSFPLKLRELVEEGLVDYVAMDIKNSPEKYGITLGIPDYDMTPVKESIALLKENRVPYEFRTTVVAEFHTAADFEGIGKLIEGAPAYYLQGFTDSGNLIGENLHPCTKAQMEEFRALAAPHVGLAAIRGVD